MLLVAMPFAPSSVLALGSDAISDAIFVDP